MKSSLRYLFTILTLFALGAASTFGGPIIKNPTFFLGDYQEQYQRIGRASSAKPSL